MLSYEPITHFHLRKYIQPFQSVMPRDRLCWIALGLFNARLLASALVRHRRAEKGGAMTMEQGMEQAPSPMSVGGVLTLQPMRHMPGR